MGQDDARAAHTLSEILLDDRTTEEKVRGAAKSAPFWVIAIMGHLILLFVFGMVVLRQESAKAPAETLVSELRQPAEDLKIEERPQTPDDTFRSAIPTDVAPLESSKDDFETLTMTDVPVNPEAVQTGNPGLDEGTLDRPNDVWSMSRGGYGLATAIGLGNTGHAGGGAPRGRPGLGTPMKRRNEQAAILTKEIKVVNQALKWLKAHQSPDGSWDCDGFFSNCDPKRGPACTGAGQAVFDSGVTGLALLAFLGAGYDSLHGEYQDVIRNGLRYLRSVQDAEGCFGPRSDTRHTYSHACATIAMCEGYAATHQVQWKKSAQEGIAYINACQNPYKAWRYGKRPGDNDSSVTGWMLMALKAAKDAGLEIDGGTMRDGLAFIDSITDEDTGRTGYIKKGELPVRPEGMTGKFPATESEALTAVAMTARIFCDAADPRLMKAGAELLAKKLPVWDETKGSVDMYYWYYGTLAMFQIGGDNWERWNKALKNAVVDHQHGDADGCLAGSWDPIDPWSAEGGRVYSTSLMALCFEVYYRYPKVFGAKR